MERSQRQLGQRVSGVAKAPQDDQHTVYTTGAGPVVGSGSAAPPKRLPIRSPDSTPKKPKKSKSRQLMDDFVDYRIGIEEFLRFSDEELEDLTGDEFD